MEIGIYITADIISSARAIFGRPYRQFLAPRAVSCRRTLRWTPFSQCSLATSGRCAAITCSFIALALDIHVFCLRAEAEGAILHTTKKVCGMRSEFSISCGRGQCVLVASPLLDVRITKCGRV